ncbi:MAG: methylated-DNA--[Clostridia bacterium]|nr:methylated-DNA--[protein]-cysteine S-methyltransferase [Clostridia bacterium]
MDSPLGKLTLTESDGALTRLAFTPDASYMPPQTSLLQTAVWQLNAYFTGALQQFDLPLRPAGTAFQQQVWQALLRIPYGHTFSYGQLAAAVGRPKACRAAGSANGRNPLPILIPCHRVILSDGSLGGYSGGIDKKRMLLDLEQNQNT